MLLQWRYYLFWYYKLLCHFVAAIWQNLGWIMSIMVCFGGVSGVCCTSFQNFEDAWRSYGTDEDILFVFKDSWWLFSLHLVAVPSGVRSLVCSRQREGLETLGWGDPWRRFLSHCRILMSVVAHGFGAAASPTKNRKLNGCGNLERKGTFRTKCAHLMYLVWHWLPHLYLSISSFFFSTEDSFNRKAGKLMCFWMSQVMNGLRGHACFVFKSVSRFWIGTFL